MIIIFLRERCLLLTSKVSRIDGIWLVYQVCVKTNHYACIGRFLGNIDMIDMNEGYAPISYVWSDRRTVCDWDTSYLKGYSNTKTQGQVQFILSARKQPVSVNKRPRHGLNYYCPQWREIPQSSLTTGSSSLYLPPAAVWTDFFSKRFCSAMQWKRSSRKRNCSTMQ